MRQRGSGILLHITSLPGAHGIGDLGPSAYQFADFLAETGQKFWQILPLNPTLSVHGNSPYSSYSAFAGNPLLISPDLLVRDGLLSAGDMKDRPESISDMVPYEEVSSYKGRLLAAAYDNFRGKMETDCEFQLFCRENSPWLDDYTLFVALKEHFGGAPWNKWPEDLKNGSESSMAMWREKLAEPVAREQFRQHLFFKQWFKLREYCNEKGIQIIGDLPIYVNDDSSDVWTHQEIFKLNQNGAPAFMAGVPPDYFSATGQLWGNPVYNWEALKKTDYAWWLSRMGHNLRLFNWIRLDHFRGFVACWEVPAGEKTAVKGKWASVPVWDFFAALYSRFSCLPIIAEDLGIITADVREVIRAFDLPTMKVLLFAFGGDTATNPYAPHNHSKNCVVYTGTHDNNTVSGWFDGEAGAEARKGFCAYWGRKVSYRDVHWEFIRLAMMSVADLSIIPMQDVLGLGEKARMNLPASPTGNWAWRMTEGQVTLAATRKLHEMTRTYGRA